MPEKIVDILNAISAAKGAEFTEGFVAGVNAACRALGKEPFIFPEETMIGSMAWYISHGEQTLFQPMNANFGIVPPLAKKVKGGKRARNEALAQRALETIGETAAKLQTYTETCTES